jgi:RNA-directed DNA polymerase
MLSKSSSQIDLNVEAMQSALVQSAFHKAHRLFGQQFAIEIKGHAEKYQVLLSKLAMACACGKTRRARETQSLIFRSFSAMLVCLIRSLDDEHGLTIEKVKSTADQLDPFSDCGESVVAWAKEKSSGFGWRPICSFGPKRQALHRLVVDVLQARFGDDNINFLSRGRGAERASDRIVELYEKHGFSHFVVTDIQNFFRSVQVGKVSELIGLPEAIVKNCVLMGPTVPLSIGGGLPPDCTIQTLDGAVREGLPQGSRASQVVAAILLGPALRSVISEERVILHGDDIALAAQHAGDATTLKKALIETLEAHPAGPFRIKHCDINTFQEGFNYLQYRHRRDPFTHHAYRHPSSRSYARYRKRVVGTFLTYKFPDAFKRTARYRYLWMKSFRRWKWICLSKLALWQMTIDAMDEGLKKRVAFQKKYFHPL